MKRTKAEIYDELLVARCQLREVTAWDELVCRWNDRLLYYIRRLIDHEQDATNVLQETWLRVFRGLRFLKKGSRFAPWLYTIARRSAMDHFRRTYSRHEDFAVAAADDGCEEVVDVQLQLDNAELVHYGLGQLGMAQREVLTLFFLEDLTVDEVAQLLGIPGGTVKSRLYKARRDLKRVLEREALRHD